MRGRMVEERILAEEDANPPIIVRDSLATSFGEAVGGQLGQERLRIK